MKTTTQIRPGHRRAGFTLVEALAAILFVAVVMPVVLQGLRLVARAGLVAHQRAEAVQLAEAKLKDIVTNLTWLNGDLADTFGDDWPGYRWELKTDLWEQGDLQQPAQTQVGNTSVLKIGSAQVGNATPAVTPADNTMDVITVVVYFSVQGRGYNVAVSTLGDEAVAQAQLESASSVTATGGGL